MASISTRQVDFINARSDSRVHFVCKEEGQNVVYFFDLFLPTGDNLLQKK